MANRLCKAVFWLYVGAASLALDICAQLGGMNNFHVPQRNNGTPKSSTFSHCFEPVIVTRRDQFRTDRKAMSVTS